MAKKKKLKEAEFKNVVTHNDLASLKDEIIDAVKEIVANKPTVPQTTSEVTGSAQPNNIPPTSTGESSEDALSPQYQKIFTKYFDPEDGFDARLVWPQIDDKTGIESGGITFTIIVPEKFSNTNDGYRKQHPVDLRTRALQAHAMAKGIEDWCRAVSKNLKYNRLMKTK